MDDLQALEAALLSGMDGQSDSLEPLCSIDPTTRRITVPDNVFGVESDEQAKRVYFSVPTVVGDNFDLSKARIQINFRNPNGDLGVYLVKDFAADAEGNATFSWSLRRIVTQYKGIVNFVVCATMTTEDNRIDREWNTTLAQGEVLEGLEVTQEMESLAHDIIGQLILAADEADSAASVAVNQVAAAAQAQKEAALTAIRTESISQQNTITKKAQEALQDIPESYVELSNQVNQMSEDLKGVAPAIIPTATGSIVNITDGAARPAVEVISHIALVQEGSGEPSRNNLRPLIGRDSVSLPKTGKNILPGGGDEKTGSFLLYATDKAFVGAKGREINVSFDLYSPDGSKVSIYAYQQSGLSIGSGYDFMPSTGVYARYSFNTSIIKYGQTLNAGNIIFYSPSGAAVKVKNVQVEFGTTATGYEPYQGQTLTTDLPETVHGGAVNLTTGVLTVAWVKQALRAKATIVNAEGLVYNDFALEKNGFATSTAETTMLCNCLSVLPSLSPGHVYAASTEGGYFLLEDQSLSNTSAVNAYLASVDAHIVYKLANPYTIQLTPQQLSMLKGTNNVWSDCGETTLSYIADTKSYIDQKLAAIAAATL